MLTLMQIQKQSWKSIESDENEIKDRFYKDLEFGTAGLRGIIGAGTNRMNIYTVRKATQGLANYIIEEGRRREKALRLHMIPDVCPRNLQTRQHAAWLRTESKHMYSNRLRPTPELILCGEKAWMYRRNQHYSQP